jgi:hypothetical protein
VVLVVGSRAGLTLVSVQRVGLHVGSNGSALMELNTCSALQQQPSAHGWALALWPAPPPQNQLQLAPTAHPTTTNPPSCNLPCAH